MSTTAAPMMRGAGEIKDRYRKLEKDREPFLQRGRDQSRITIPHLLPPDEHTNQADLAEPYQSIGARGVNNLSSKLLLALFPPNAKFFRMDIDEGEVDEDVDSQRVEIEEALAEIEDQALGRFEQEAMRIKLFNALRLTVATGNALFHMPARRPPRVFRLDSYVVDRDPRGNITQIITKQMVSPLLLPEALRMIGKALGDKGAGKSDHVEVYTGVFLTRVGNRLVWREWQEVEGFRIGDVTVHEYDRLPYVAMRMYSIDGESYGRSHVEEFMGDLRSLEGLSEALHDGALAAARVIPLVDPDGTTRLHRLQKAKNGQYIPGRKDDVTFLQLEKFQDFRVVMEQINALERRLGLVFLLNSTATRHAERVTAEEIRFVAQELEDTLGGTYSLMSQDLQLPIVNVLLGRLQDEDKIPKLPEFVKPVIVTGLDAIGRGHDLMRLDNFITDVVTKLGPEGVQQYVNIPVYLQMRATALGISTEELIKSPEQVAQEQQQAMLARTAEKLGPTALKQFPDEVKEATENLRESGAFGGAGGPNLRLA